MFVVNMIPPASPQQDRKMALIIKYKVSQIWNAEFISSLMQTKIDEPTF
jgi:hypothetical protein